MPPIWTRWVTRASPSSCCSAASLSLSISHTHSLSRSLSLYLSRSLFISVCLYISCALSLSEGSQPEWRAARLGPRILAQLPGNPHPCPGMMFTACHQTHNHSEGPYRRPLPRVLGGPRVVGVFLRARYPCKPELLMLGARLRRVSVPGMKFTACHQTHNLICKHL